MIRVAPGLKPYAAPVRPWNCQPSLIRLYHRSLCRGRSFCKEKIITRPKTIPALTVRVDNYHIAALD